MDNLKDRLYELLQQPEYRSKKPPAMSEELNISLKELNPVIEELLQEGKAILTSSGKVAYPETHGYVRGTYDAASHGFGFIIPEDEVHGGKTFIPGRFNMGAMHGDRVMARVTCAPSRGKCAEGEIVRIFERSVQELCGTFYRTRGREYVVPDESKMGVEINIKRGKSRNARPGDKVLLRIVEYAKGTTYARGEVLRVLGEAQSLGANYESVLIHYNVR